MTIMMQQCLRMQLSLRNIHQAILSIDIYRKVSTVAHLIGTDVSCSCRENQPLQIARINKQQSYGMQLSAAVKFNKYLTIFMIVSLIDEMNESAFGYRHSFGYCLFSHAC
jgi:hypothetical protein